MWLSFSFTLHKWLGPNGRAFTNFLAKQGEIGKHHKYAASVVKVRISRPPRASRGGYSDYKAWEVSQLQRVMLHQPFPHPLGRRSIKTSYREKSRNRWESAGVRHHVYSLIVWSNLFVWNVWYILSHWSSWYVWSSWSNWSILSILICLLWLGQK
jgi:hypothetical protein